MAPTIATNGAVSSSGPSRARDGGHAAITPALAEASQDVQSDEDLVALWGDDDGEREEREEHGAEPDEEVLGEDPLHSELSEPISFKRKQKPWLFSRGGRLFGFGSSRTSASQMPSSGDTAEPQVVPTRLNTFPPTDGTYNHRTDSLKATLPTDWYVEGPGRRVGYEDLTAIDWIFEYTKERQRQRVLQSSTSGVLGYVQQLLDASQVWIILILTGIAVGALAAGIDVATDWLADLKGGYCSAAGDSGGAFYLSKTFCCMGHDESSACRGWRPWAAALGVASVGGKWFLEYFFFVLFSMTFALCAGLLVREFAIYAKHSGIPELKTILGGFIIRRFLGAWTLVTKSLGLVRQLSLHQFG
jgi:chloride channel 3/4/5